MSEFGAEFDEIWPKAGIPNLRLTDFGKNHLQKCQILKKPETRQIDLKQFLEKSQKFPLKFGTDNCRVMSQPETRYSSIEQQIASAYPIIHERVLGLYLAFLEHKSQFGTKNELKIFKNLTLVDFVQRLLTKRCVSFFGKRDTYLLITGKRGYENFEQIGTDAEKQPLLIKDVLSYDEIKLSALLSVSSHSEFLNNGNRRNKGIIERNDPTIEREGVIIGMIGARFDRPNAMEYQDIIISQTQNTIANGYGQRNEDIATMLTRVTDYRRIWRQFYDEEQDFLYEHVNKNGRRFGESRYPQDIFDNVLMKKRYAISFDMLLLESEARAAVAGKRAYIHVVGFGLGVWKAARQQEKIFLEVFAERIKVLLPQLSHVAVIHFSWFEMSEWRDLKNGGIFKSDTHPDGGIRTFLSVRNPADKLTNPEFNNMLLVVSYAWDGNALPGNEFWLSSLCSSSDPAAACSTLITELHNPHINTELVNGANLHIASAEYGVLHIADYSRQVLG